MYPTLTKPPASCLYEGSIMSLERRKEIASRIRARREYLRLSQQQVATQVGVERSAFAHWEAARVGIDSVVLEQIAKALKVNVAWLYGEEVDTAIAPDDAKMIRRLQSLPPEARAGVVGMIEHMETFIKQADVPNKRDKSADDTEQE
jgi:transcriptional regulator with XRE-family HTH domain